MRPTGAVSLGNLGGIGLDLMLAGPPPHDQPNLGSGGAAEHYRSIGQSALTID
jgi:hypothetical protein